MTTDPRFDGGHLNPSRRERYEDAREELFDACGPVTTEVERDAVLAQVRAVLSPDIPPGVPYALLDVRTGRYFPLRVGLTAVGRLPENDLVLPENPISRRHCVILVHATGGCEVHDTESRNGTRVNGRRIDRVWLVPGDELRLCDRRYLLAASAAREELVFGALPADGSADDPPTNDYRTTIGSWCGA